MFFSDLDSVDEEEVIDEDDTNTVTLQINDNTTAEVLGPASRNRNSRYAWVPAEEDDLTTHHEYTGSELPNNFNLRTPFEYVKDFLTDEFLQIIVFTKKTIFCMCVKNQK